MKKVEWFAMVGGVVLFWALIFIAITDVGATTVTSNDQPDRRCNVITATWGVTVSPNDPERLNVDWVQGFGWEDNNPVPVPYDSRADEFVNPSGAFVNVDRNRWVADAVIFCPRPGVSGFPPSDCIRVNSGYDIIYSNSELAFLREVHPYLYEVEPFNLGPVSYVQVVDTDLDEVTGALRSAIITTQICEWNIVFKQITARPGVFIEPAQ